MRDIPLEQIVKVSSTLNPAATAEWPESKAVLDRCGQYIYITKDKSKANTLEAEVAGWKVEDDVAVGRGGA